MSTPYVPITLPAASADLYVQVADALTNDTDEAAGVLAALGNGEKSLYPNFDTPGPSADRTVCPVPFVICVNGGIRALDKQTREHRVHIEVHDESDYGNERIAGIVERIKEFLIAYEWRPADQAPYVRYASGLQFESESPLLDDETYNTRVVQLTLLARATDRTSNRGQGKMAGPNATPGG